MKAEKCHYQSPEVTPVCFLGAFFTSAELQSVRLYPYTNSLHIFVVAAEVIYFLFIVYYMIIQVRPMGSLAESTALSLLLISLTKALRLYLISVVLMLPHQWKFESGTVSVLNNRKAMLYLAGMMLLRKIMRN